MTLYGGYEVMIQRILVDYDTAVRVAVAIASS
jgi:hypothetical protein